MRKLTSVFLATTLVLSASSIAHAANENTTAPAAGHEMGKPHPHHGPRDMMLLKGITLTDAQRAQMKTLFQDNHKQMPRPDSQDRKIAHDLVTADAFDTAKAKALAERTANQNAQRNLQRLETQHKIYQLLTSDQKKQYNANFEKMSAMKPGMHQAPPAQDDHQ